VILITSVRFALGFYFFVFVDPTEGSGAGVASQMRQADGPCMVAHAECLKEKTFKEADNLHEEIDSKIEDINEAKKDLKDIKKMLIEHINGLEF